MNQKIEILNQWGGRWLEFAWPMLWQSSVLIAVVLALDYVLARKIRASVRHALWLVVLVKLLLPPALALPTGIMWWLSPGKSAAKLPALNHYTVTLSDIAPLSERASMAFVAAPEPPSPT